MQKLHKIVVNNVDRRYMQNTQPFMEPEPLMTPSLMQVTRNCIREARARAIQQKNYGLLTSGALDDSSEGKHAAVWRKGGRKPKLQTEHAALYEELAIQLECDHKPMPGFTEEKTQELVPTGDLPAKDGATS